MSVEEDVRKMREMIEEFMDAIDDELPMGEYDQLDRLYSEAYDLLRDIR